MFKFEMLLLHQSGALGCSADIRALSKAGIQDLLAKAQMIGGHFQKLIGIHIFDGLLKAHEPGRNKAERFVRAGGAGIGKVLGLAYVYVDVYGFAALSDDHTGVNFFAGADEELSALLRVEKAVCNSSSRFERDQRALLAVNDVALIRRIAVEDRIHNAVSLGIRKEIASVADQTAGRDGELESGVTSIDDPHVEQLTLALTEFLDDGSGEFLGNVDKAGLHRLKELSVFIFLVDDLGFADRELIAFTAHCLDEDGEMKLAAAGYLKGFGRICIFHTQGHVRIELSVQPVTEVAAGDILAVFAGERGVVDAEGHRDRGLRNLLERNSRRRIGRADRITDMEIGDTGYSYDRSDMGFIHLNAPESLKFVELTDLDLSHLVGVVVVYDDAFLIHFQGSAVCRLPDRPEEPGYNR